MSVARKIARKAIKEKAKKLVTALKKGKKRDYIVRINVDTLRSVAVISVPATSRKEAVELVKGAIELTGEVAPLTINQLERSNMEEEIVETPAEEAVVEAPVEEAVESAE